MEDLLKKNNIHGKEQHLTRGAVIEVWRWVDN